MLKFAEKNKKYILGLVTIGLFGIVGGLLVCVIMCIIKVSDRYPKVFREIRWIFFSLFVLAGIYGFLVESKWDMSFVMICAAAATGRFCIRYQTDDLKMGVGKKCA